MAVQQMVHRDLAHQQNKCNNKSQKLQHNPMSLTQQSVDEVWPAEIAHEY